MCLDKVGVGLSNKHVSSVNESAEGSGSNLSRVEKHVYVREKSFSRFEVPASYVARKNFTINNIGLDMSLDC